MRKVCCTLFLLCILLTLSACGIHSAVNQDNVVFYYPRATFQYGAADAIMAEDIRDLADHASDPNYMIGLYLMGPLADGLEAAFPADTQLVTCEVSDDSAVITLAGNDAAMPDIRFTIACGCLARTCMTQHNWQQVTIIRNNQSLTLNQQSLLLLDNNSAEGEKPQ